MTEGPKIKISNVDFIGNKEYSDGKIRGKMKTNKAAAASGSSPAAASTRKTSSKKTPSASSRITAIAAIYRSMSASRT